MSVEGFLKLIFQILDASPVAEVNIVPGHQVKDHAVVNRFKAYDLLIVEVGQHLIQLMDAVKNAGKGEAAAVDIGIVGLQVFGKLLGVLH